ncbi:HD domain-containing protein [Baekduia soli]|uniref:HD domain-containing protein n=1 Tax=Baekduia soli TaxID=496014 RepID=A0A5B8U0B3_9ACTN|nr:HD domain-containing phosphohydrolase [Baekduia soli]QEC46401.1 HD domain-containing protein [Baekduia soli]
MQTHAQVGHEMLSGCGSDLLDLAAWIALTHHQRHDGGGHPHGLRGDDIPLAGRIVAVADAFDAIPSGRVHKDAVAVPVAAAIIHAGRGAPCAAVAEKVRTDATRGPSSHRCPLTRRTDTPDAGARRARALALYIS